MPYIKSKTVIIDENNYNKNYKIEKSIDDYVSYINKKNGGSNTKITPTKYNTYCRKKSDLKKFLNFRDLKYQKIKYTYQITNEMIKDFIDYISTIKSRNNIEYSANSKFTFFTSFKSYINYIAELNALKLTTYKYVKNLEYGVSSKKRIQIESEIGYITLSTIQQIFKNLEATKEKRNYKRNKCLILLLLHGFRRDEIRFLRWNCIDFETSTIKIFLNKVDKRSTVYISKETIDALKDYKESLNFELKQDNMYIFCSKTIEKNKKMTAKGFEAMSAATISNTIDSLTDNLLDSNQKPITARTFRKTFTVMNLKIGTSLSLIQSYTKHTLTVLQKNYNINFENLELNPHDSLEYYFDFIEGNVKDKATNLTKDDILKNKKLTEELREHFFKEFYQNFTKNFNFQQKTA